MSIPLRSTWLTAALALAAAPAGPRASVAAPSGAPDDVQVTVSLDAAEQSGSAQAEVTIHARREVVWSLITSCTEALTLVPGLQACRVLETAPDGSWQRIRHVLDYSWYLPRLTYEFRASYVHPVRISIERVSGDLTTLRASWDLDGVEGGTRARYAVVLVPGFWVPHWLVRAALRRDLPKMLRSIAARAESIQARNPG
ncbi:MAG TPA: SRPBCC family protein [Steroidobacteraceae bacterium]|nr:SRPBCC family protein [Steroidobacteraceae bacterium]